MKDPTFSTKESHRDSNRVSSGLVELLKSSGFAKDDKGSIGGDSDDDGEKAQQYIEVEETK